MTPRSDAQKMLIPSRVFALPLIATRRGAGLAMRLLKWARCRLRSSDEATWREQLHTQNEGVTVFFIALV